ncbi:MAG: zf-HC2 domain-containing protein [Oscillospiraceae bacterium]|nr:zf-HC2 domain-containing protein [Oscillospiraceae bacterium]
MDVTCNVIDDLIPLYADGICSEDTKTIIEHHIAVCPECREKLKAMTATLEKNEKKAEIDNPFKKVKRHYLRLVTVTLLVCAIFIVPLGTAWFLKTNEVYDAGYSWATVTTNAKLRKIGNLFKKGKYREALDLFDLNCNAGDYTEEQKAYFKDEYARLFAICYNEDGSEIKKFSCYAENGKAEKGYITFSTQSYGNEGMRTFTMCFVNENGELRFHDYIGAGFEYLPNMCLPDKNEASDYFNYMSDEYFNDPKYTHWVIGHLYTEEMVTAIQQHTDNDPDESDPDFMLGEIGSEKHKKLKEMLSIYGYVSCENGETSWCEEPIDLYGIMDLYQEWIYYLQRTTLTMEKDSEVFTVTFDLPIFKSSGDYACYTGVRNITYSDNTPEDFKAMFEDIFA